MYLKEIDENVTNKISLINIFVNIHEMKTP